MGLHAGEILEGSTLPRRYVTVSTCFRREAGAAGKDTAGLYRIHQFDKVEQVVLCRADEQESRAWHKKMLGFVETLMQRLELPYRLLQCCTADLGPKNADQSTSRRGCPAAARKAPTAGRWASTARRTRPRACTITSAAGWTCATATAQTGKVVVCHSLNNTVIASPRILIPILELYQNADGTVTVPAGASAVPGRAGADRAGRVANRRSKSGVCHDRRHETRRHAAAGPARGGPGPRVRAEGPRHQRHGPHRRRLHRRQADGGQVGHRERPDGRADRADPGAVQDGLHRGEGHAQRGAHRAGGASPSAARRSASSPAPARSRAASSSCARPRRSRPPGASACAAGPTSRGPAPTASRAWARRA